VGTSEASVVYPTGAAFKRNIEFSICPASGSVEANCVAREFKFIYLDTWNFINLRKLEMGTTGSIT